MQEEKVSVILPIYNAEKYLKECVDSVINQTYSNLQIILVNDGSTDNSWEICQELKNVDSRIVIANQKNSGVSVARNRGLEIADGKWIMFVDPDDVLDKTIVTNLLSKMNDQIDIVACSCYGFNNKSREKSHFFKSNRLFTTNKEDLYLQLLDSGYGQEGNIFTAIGVPWAKIYRHSFIKENNLKFDPQLRRMQDNIFNMYAFYYARAIYYLDEPLYFYRIDHITNYGKQHITTFEKIFLPVVEARFNGLNRLGLIDKTAIYNGYINEASIFLVDIVRSRLLNNSNKRDCANSIRELADKPCFKDIFSKNILRILRGKKLKVKILLIKLRLYIFLRY